LQRRCTRASSHDDEIALTLACRRDHGRDRRVENKTRRDPYVSRESLRASAREDRFTRGFEGRDERGRVHRKGDVRALCEHAARVDRMTADDLSTRIAPERERSMQGGVGERRAVECDQNVCEHARSVRLPCEGAAKTLSLRLVSRYRRGRTTARSRARDDRAGHRNVVAPAVPTAVNGRFFARTDDANRARVEIAVGRIVTLNDDALPR